METFLMYKGSVIKIDEYKQEFEIWRNGFMIACYRYNTNKSLIKCIDDALES